MSNKMNTNRFKSISWGGASAVWLYRGIRNLVDRSLEDNLIRERVYEKVNEITPEVVEKANELIRVSASYSSYDTFSTGLDFVIAGVCAAASASYIKRLGEQE